MEPGNRHPIVDDFVDAIFTGFNMADVFGDLSLFSEFEKEREAEGSFIHYGEDTERSRIIFEGFESDSDEEEEECAVPQEDESDETPSEATAKDAVDNTEENKSTEKDDKNESVNGNASHNKSVELSKDDKKVLSIDNEKAIAWLNDQLHEEAAEEAKRSNASVNQMVYEKNKYRRFSRILDSTRYVPDEDSPAVQLLFSNNSFSRKYRQQIEQFIKGLLWNEFTSGQKISDAFQEVTARPGAPSCIDVNEKLTSGKRSETMRQKHTFIGSSQFHNKFLIDFLGWPFSVSEPTRCNVNWEIPLYNQIFNEVFADPTNKGGKPTTKKKLKPSCWNCGTENHSVAECRLPRNPQRIAANRKEYMELQSQHQSSNVNKFTNPTRYHLDPEIASKYAKFQPGQVSNSLMKALGLRDDQLPQHIYNMRLYGYPPGWLAEAKQIQSSVNMFDKNGRVTLITGECLEDGELNDDGAGKDPTSDYDINKIIEYPGFTVAVPDGCVDEHEVFSMPPIQEHQLKQTLMKQSTEKVLAKKRKRETEQEEKKKAREEAKKAKMDGEEGEIEDREDDNEEATQEMEETTEVPKMNKSSSTISISKDYGTPILVREKSDLPDASKFGVGVEDHIPFENLPNSTGTFEKMKDLIDLIRKKKTESCL